MSGVCFEIGCIGVITTAKNAKHFEHAVTDVVIFYLRRHTMRTRITLACTECKNRNYDTTKDKKTHPDRMETKKYCRFCKRHTMHKETK